MPHQQSQNSSQGELAPSTAVAPLSPLSRPFAEGEGNLPHQSLCAPKSGRVGGTRTGALTGDFWVEERKQEKMRVSCRHSQNHNLPQCGRFEAFGSGSAKAEKTNDCVRSRKKPGVSGFFGVSEADPKEV